jgi:hypothetical protein
MTEKNIALDPRSSKSVPAHIKPEPSHRNHWQPDLSRHESARDTISEEFKASAIADDIAALNFRYWNPFNENDLDEVFTLLVAEPEHRNNGTLAGRSQNDLANTLRSGGWIFEGYLGVSVKPDFPRRNAEGKVIKYESPRGAGNQQLFVPRVSVRVASEIARKLGVVRDLNPIFAPAAEDLEFWDWFLSTGLPLIITEGAKKAAALVSAGYPAIALNGIWGWGSNEKDMFGEVERGSRGESLKILNPDLEPFLDDREIVLAFDRDEKPDTIKTVEAAKKRFRQEIEGIVAGVTQLKWKGHKGVDDFLAAKGVKKLDLAYSKRSKVELPVLKEKRETIGDLSLKLAKSATYFHTADKVAYADIWIEGNRHTYAVRSRAFRLWLSGEYYKVTSRGISSQALQDTLSTLEAIAIFDGETRSVHLRTAEYQGKTYLDLGTPDWRVAEVDSLGWRIISEPPVRFWRPESLLPLPVPVEGGNLNELKDLLNVDGASWTLIITFLLFCLQPDQTYPVLVLSAHRGSGKTAAAEILKGLVDPGKAPLIKLQGDTHKLAVAASRRNVMVYDNVGNITPDQSDDLCRIATGFGYSTRTLHTTDEETTFELTRPQIITAIDALVTRDDLADRVLMAQLPEISDRQRLPQSQLNAKVEAARPRILGALLTALSQTLAQLPHTKPVELPRMGDYGLFAIASEQALGLQPGEFMRTFSENREQSRQVVIESSPVGEAIVRLMEKTASTWKGTASELLNELEQHTDEATYRSRYFPKASNMLKRQLNRLTPDLKALGIDVREGIRSNNKEPRSIILEKVVKVSSTSSTSSTSEIKPLQGEDLSVDDTKNSYRPPIVHSPESIVHSSESGRYLSSTPEVSSTYRPLTEPIDSNGLNLVVDDVDDVDDKKTLFSKEDEKFKIGELVKPSDPYHGRGQDIGIVEAIEGEQYLVQWESDDNIRRYSHGELQPIIKTSGFDDH